MSHQTIQRWLPLMLVLELPPEAKLQSEAGCCKCQASAAWQEVWGMLRPDAACESLKDFRKVYSMSQDRPLVWKSYWQQLGWVCMLGGAGSQTITRVGQTVLTELIETHIWWPPGLQARQGRAQQKNNTLYQHFCLGKLSDNLVPAYISLAPFKLLSQSWISEQVSLSLNRFM